MDTQEKDVCTKGKSCKTTCIKSNLVCRESIGQSVQDGLKMLVSKLTESAQKVLPKPEPPKPKDPASVTIEKGKEFLKGYEARLNGLDKSIRDLKMLSRKLEDEANSSKSVGKGGGAVRSRLSQTLDQIKAKNEEMAAVMMEIREKMMGGSVSQPQALKMVSQIGIVQGGAEEKAVRGQLGEFAQMFGGKGFGNVKGTPKDVYPLTDIFFDKKERSWANPSMGHMALNGDKAVTFHEMAHFVERQRPWLQKYATQWRNGKAWDTATVKEMYGMEDVPPPILHKIRSGGRQLPVIPMSYIAGSKSYGKDEFGFADEYMNPYMGKIYSTGGTEVISMAMEQFASPRRMATLRRAHPELFNLVVGLSQSE